MVEKIEMERQIEEKKSELELARLEGELEEARKVRELKLAKMEKELEEVEKRPTEEEKEIGKTRVRVERVKVEIEEIKSQLELAKLHLELKRLEETALVEEERCQLCLAPLPQDAHYCPRCRRLTQKFKRLCPFCKKGVDLKANECLSCGHRFPLSVGKMLYIVCANCDHAWEPDDWAADRNLPFLFQTEKGVKIAAFQDIERATQMFRKYFVSPLIGASSLTGASLALRQSDEEPWQFASADAAKMFLANFPCANCGRVMWQLSRTRWIVEKMKPQAAKAAQGFAGWLSYHFSGAVEDIRKYRKDARERGERTERR